MKDFEHKQTIFLRAVKIYKNLRTGLGGVLGRNILVPYNTRTPEGIVQGEEAEVPVEKIEKFLKGIGEL